MPLLVSCERFAAPAPAAGTPDPKPPAPPGDPLAVSGQRGVSFRASGIEPGWYLEVTGGERPTQLELVWDYASNRLESGEVTRADTGAVLTFQASGEGFAATVRAERTPCVEPGSGARADYTVVVQVGAQTLRGCGRGR